MTRTLPTEINYLVEGFCSKTLPKEAWTHEAHLLTGLWHVIAFGKENALEKMRSGIKTYNESVGGINSETSGYHETITVFWIWVLDGFYKNYQADNEPIATIYDAFLASKYTDRNLTLQFYSREKLFSVEARLSYVSPDLQAFDFEKI